MICLLLCAGYATRMYPLTENFPKPLLEIKGKTIIDYLIDDLNDKNYISRYIIVSNHKFINYFNDWKKTRKENITVLDDGSTCNENRLGAVRDIQFCIDEENINEDIIVLAGDNLLDFSLNDFIESYQNNKENQIMYYDEIEIERLKKTGVITLKGNQVETFEEKPKQPKSNKAVPPFYIFKKESLDMFSKGIDEGCKVDSPGMFLEWFSKNNRIVAWPMKGKRIDIGSLEEYYRCK